MKYNNYKDIQLSALGFGCMRLPLNSDNTKDINEELTQKMVDYAIDNGVNYFDTAYLYHEGESEKVIGNCLAKHSRDKFNIATKFPGYDNTKFNHHEEIFIDQLSKLKVDYIDFYLLHNVNELNLDLYLDKNIGTVEYFINQKKLGKIKYLGFSSHARLGAFKKFLEVYGSEMEFCQLQLNWIDWTLQEVKEKVDLLRKYNIPVWVMEPLRGGRLLNIKEDQIKPLKEFDKERNLVEWSFDFVRSIPDVKMILSGMSNFEQMKDNVRIFSEDVNITKEEFDSLVKLGKSVVSGVPCTGCSYCTHNCPKGLVIPDLMKAYNEYKVSGDCYLVRLIVKSQGEGKRPFDCLGCGECEKLCPQQIKIPSALKELASIYEKK